jgi:DNA-binding NtrC family response regulator
VRELRNVCERLSILMAGRVIQDEHLPADIINHMPRQTALFSLPETGIQLEQVGVELIRQALQRTNGNRSRSARLLGISRDTLLYRMKKHGITTDEDRGGGAVQSIE